MGLGSDDLSKAKAIALDNLESDEGCTHISYVLGNADEADIEQLVASTAQPTQLFHLSKIILSVKQRKGTFNPHIAELVGNLVLDESLGIDQRFEFVDKLVSRTPAVVAAGVETAAISHLLGREASSRSLNLIATFVKNRPNISLRQIPFLCAGVRQVLSSLKTSSDQEENSTVSLCIHQLINTIKRKKEDWSSVAPYILADLLNTSTAIDQQNVKQNLLSSVNLLLDIGDSHSHEYLSANLPAATNEIFKVSS